MMPADGAGRSRSALLKAQAAALRAQADVLDQLAVDGAIDDEAAANDTSEGGAPRLLDRVGIARALDKSPASVDRLCRDGQDLAFPGL